jgi:hypothetical protein
MRFAKAMSWTVVLTLALDVLLNAVMFRTVYRTAAPFLRPSHELNALVPLGWLALVAMTAANGWLFVRSGWRGRRRGIEFGCVLAFTGIAGLAGLASVFSWPISFVAVVAIQQVANGLLLGMVFGSVYR